MLSGGVLGDAAGDFCEWRVGALRQDPFAKAMLAHVADALAEAGYHMLLSKVSVHQNDRIERLFRTRRAAAGGLKGEVGQDLQAGARLLVKKLLTLLASGTPVSEMLPARLITPESSGG